MCAGCFCKFDRRKVLQTLVDAFAETCTFEYSYKKQEEKKIRDKKLQAQYVYDRLSQESKELFSSIVKTATKSSYSDVYILQGMNSCSQVVAQLSNILYGDNMINSWVSIDETSENVCIYIKSPLNEIIESNNK